MATIDLERFATSGVIELKNLSGFNFGRGTRREVGLDKLDAEEGPHTIKIPKRVDYIESGFLEGLFGKSMKVLETPEDFFAHYKFEASSFAMGDIRTGVERMYKHWFDAA